MDKTTLYPFSLASKSADYILQLLRPYCDRIHLAGSLRRLRPEVKDIEIVCQPKREMRQSGLFPDITEEVLDRSFVEALATITDHVSWGTVYGRYTRIRTNSKVCPGICLDLFMPQPEDYFRQLAIRTGSADYAHQVIATAWKAKGWVGTAEGLRKAKECRQHQSGTWKCIVPHPTHPPVWQSEGQFFTWLGLEYIDPEFRELHKPINEAL